MVSLLIIRISVDDSGISGIDGRQSNSPGEGETARRPSPPGLEQLPYLTFLMAMMKKQPMMASAMDVGNAKL